MSSAAHQHPQLVRWTRVLPAIALLVFAAIGVFIDPWIAIALAIVCLVIGGAKAIASPRRDTRADKPDDQAWAEKTLSTSLAVETTATSIEWLALGGATFLIATGAPWEVIVASAPLLAFAIPVIVACALGQVLWERRSAQRTLDKAAVK